MKEDISEGKGGISEISKKVSDIPKKIDEGVAEIKKEVKTNSISAFWNEHRYWAITTIITVILSAIICPLILRQCAKRESIREQTLEDVKLLLGGFDGMEIAKSREVINFDIINYPDAFIRIEDNNMSIFDTIAQPKGFFRLSLTNNGKITAEDIVFLITAENKYSKFMILDTLGFDYGRIRMARESQIEFREQFNFQKKYLSPREKIEFDAIVVPKHVEPDAKYFRTDLGLYNIILECKGKKDIYNVNIKIWSSSVEDYLATNVITYQSVYNYQKYCKPYLMINDSKGHCTMLKTVTLENGFIYFVDDKGKQFRIAEVEEGKSKDLKYVSYILKPLSGRELKKIKSGKDKSWKNL
ncbi:MAG: hypothetical protein LBN23_06195 [Paludibacter sp.]|nr:hypothetical protein [Paludibacter sp.]